MITPRTIVSFLGLTLALTLWGTSSSATVILSFPNGLIISPPADVTEGGTEIPPFVVGFNERQKVTLPASFNVLGFPDLGPIVLDAGTRVSSHMIHHDPVGMADPAFGNGGGFVFDRPIIGLIVDSVGLDFTDLLLGSGVTAYPTGDPQRGLELGDFLDTSHGEDAIFLSSIPQVIGGNIEQFDQLRVLTAVPEPATLAVFCFGLGGLAFLMRRREAAA